jgi:hypothetical protein
MASLSFEDLLSISKQGSEGTSDDIEQSRAAPTAIDYAGDIIRAPIKGVSRAVQGLLELGALPIDYLANTNLIKHIDETFDKFTPETRTGIGELAATFTQFGLPLGAVTKLAGGIKFLNNATKITSLASKEAKLISLGDKAGELVRRAGYYGAIGGVADIVASVPEHDMTLSESLGLTEKKDVRELEGSERAAETLKEKFKFGAEGTVVGGAIPLLPVVGTLGWEYGILPAAKGVGLAGEAILRPLNYAIVNPLIKSIAGVETKGLIPKLMTSTSELIEKGTSNVSKALNIPPAEEWKYLSKQGTMKEYFLKTLDDVGTYFSPSGKIGPELTAEKVAIDVKIGATQKYILDTDKKIQSIFEDIITQGEKKFLKEEDTVWSLQSKNNDLFNYIKETDTDKIKTFYKMLDADVKPLAKDLKDLLRASNVTWAKSLVKEGGEKYGKLADLVIEEADGLMKQRFSSFNNANYLFPATEDAKAVQLMKQQKLANDKEGFLENAKKMADRKNISIDKAQTEIAKEAVDTLKHQIIKSGETPEYYFSAIARSFYFDYKELAKELRPGDFFAKRVGEIYKSNPKQLKQFDDVIKNLFDAPQEIIKGGERIPITNYKAALIDTITQQAKSINSKRFYDEIAKTGEKNGLIYKSLDDARAQGRSKQFVLDLQPIIPPGEDMGSFAFKESKLFGGGDPKTKQTFFATPEISKALLDTGNTQSALFDNGLYRGMMAFKSGAQIAKTLFSPMGQVRNFSSNGLVATMNGLIGGNVSLKDSYRAIAQDIFNTVSKGGEDGVSTYLNEARKYGVLDQNIEVSELKYVLNRASKGKIDFKNFIDNPVVKKLGDIYQGSDNFWKIYADKYYTAALRPAMKNLDDVKTWFKDVAKQEFNPRDLATGLDKGLEQGIREVSAHLTTNTMPTYSKVPQVIKDLRFLPFGNFIAYPAEIIRTTSNVLTIGARELVSENPYIRQMGARRLIGAATTLGGIEQAVQHSAQYITGMDSDKLDAYQRHFAPDYERNSTLIPITAPDNKGNFKYVNFSYTNPYTTILQPINAVLKAYGDGSLNKDGADTIVKNALFGTKDRPGAIREFLSPFITESIGVETMADIQYRDGKTKNGKYIYYPQDDSLTKLSKSIGHVFSTLEPGAVTSARKIWDGATGRFTDAGTVRDGATEAMALMSGIRVQEAKPMASMPFILSSYSNDRQNIGSKFSSIAYSPTATQEERIHSFRDYFIESYDNQNKMYQTLQSAKKLGIDESELRNTLMQRLKNKTDVNNLMNGIYKTPVYSEDRFKSLINRLNEESPMQASKVETQIENTKDVFRDLRGNFIGTDLSLSRGDFEKQIDKFLTPSVIRSRPTTPTPKIDLSSTFTPPNNYLQSNIPLSPNVSPAVVNSGNQNLSTKITPQKQAEYDAFFRR